MYRKTTNTIRPHRRYDFLTEVEPERLQLIGAIALAWNWLEATIDTTVATALGLDPVLWVEVQSRINGFDGKIAIIKAALPRLAPDMPEELQLSIRKGLNATGNYKSIRDHIIHMRLAQPEEEVSESYQRKGDTREVYAAIEPLKAFYSHLDAHLNEVMSISTMYFYLSIIHLHRDLQKSQPEIAALKFAGALLLERQQKRECLPPLPEVPEPDPAQVAEAVKEDLQDFEG